MNIIKFTDEHDKPIAINVNHIACIHGGHKTDKTVDIELSNGHYKRVVGSYCEVLEILK